MAGEPGVRRLDDLPPVRQRIARALMAARDARLAEDERFRDGVMDTEERAEYVQRRTYVASIRPAGRHHR